MRIINKLNCFESRRPETHLGNLAQIASNLPYVAFFVFLYLTHSFLNHLTHALLLPFHARFILFLAGFRNRYGKEFWITVISIDFEELDNLIFIRFSELIDVAMISISSFKTIF
jgi:hypothetical protein